MHVVRCLRSGTGAPEDEQLVPASPARDADALSDASRLWNSSCRSLKWPRPQPCMLALQTGADACIIIKDTRATFMYTRLTALLNRPMRAACLSRCILARQSCSLHHGSAQRFFSSSGGF